MELNEKKAETIINAITENGYIKFGFYLAIGIAGVYALGKVFEVVAKTAEHFQELKSALKK